MTGLLSILWWRGGGKEKKRNEEQKMGLRGWPPGPARAALAARRKMINSSISKPCRVVCYAGLCNSDDGDIASQQHNKEFPQRSSTIVEKC